MTTREWKLLEELRAARDAAMFEKPGAAERLRAAIAAWQRYDQQRKKATT